MQILQLFIILKQPVPISAIAYSNLTKLTNINRSLAIIGFIRSVLKEVQEGLKFWGEFYPLRLLLALCHGRFRLCMRVSKLRSQCHKLLHQRFTARFLMVLIKIRVFNNEILLMLIDHRIL